MATNIPYTGRPPVRTISPHQFEQKFADLNFYINRIHSIPLQPQDFKNELNIIKQLANEKGSPY